MAKWKDAPVSPSKTMTREQIKEMVLDILNQADYDLWKSYVPEHAEEPEFVDGDMDILIDIAEGHINGAMDSSGI